MANTPVVVLDDTLTDIANAIRGKNGSSNTYKPGQMADAIGNIPVGTLGIPREVSSGVYQMPSSSFTFSLPNNAMDVGAHAFQNAFYGCTGLTSLSFSALTTVNGSNAFYNAFYGCTSLTSVDLSSLTTVSGSNAFSNAFRFCTSLASVNFSSLTTVSGSQSFSNAFTDCTRLTSVSFPALTTSSFGSNTNQFNGMLTRAIGCTVHFPAAIQSTIGNWTSVQNGFGGTNTTVLFDL